MPNKLANRVKMTVSGTPGTGTITLGSAVSGFTSFSVGGVVNGDTVPYVIEDGVNWEIGVGTYSSTGPSLARTTVTASSNTNSAISATANAIVMLSPLAADLQSTDTLTSGTLGVARGGTGLSTLTAGYIPFGAGTSAFGNSANLFWDNTNARLGIGTSNPSAKLTVIGDITATDGFYLQSNNFVTVTLNRANASSVAVAPLSLYKSRGTIASPTILNSGDYIGQIRYSGYDGSNFINAVEIRGEVDGAPGTGSMPGRLVFATTASGASSATERMRIDSSGRVAIGSTSTSAVNLRLGANISGGATSYGILQQQTIQSDVTSAAYGSTQVLSTAAASFTIPSLLYYTAQQGTIGAGSSITNQFGFFAQSTLTGATNNFGFYGNIASGTGRWNFYAGGTADNYFAGPVQLSAGTASAPALSRFSDTNTGIFFPAADTVGISTGGSERLRIDSSGNVGLGAASQSSISFFFGGNAPAVAGPRAFQNGQLVTSSATGNYASFSSFPAVQDAAFTLPAIYHFLAGKSSFGASATVTSQIGYFADASLTGATNNYGFYSNIASGTGRWNFFANGTANNAYAGNSRFGGITAPVATVDVTGSIAATTTIRSSGATSGIGYATGAGGAVTQETSRTTGVTLNKVSGQITLVSAAGSTAWQSFTVTNSAVAATDAIIVNQDTGTDLYQIFVTNVAAGSFTITFATTGGTTTEQPVFNFAVIKAVAA